MEIVEGVIGKCEYIKKDLMDNEDREQRPSNTFN